MSKSSESKKDPAWQYARMVNPQNLSKFICNFCDKEMNGGVYRVKQHLAGGYKNVVACKKCPSHVKDEIKNYMSQKSQSKVQLRMVPDFDEMANDDDDDDEILEINQHGMVKGLFLLKVLFVENKEVTPPNLLVPNNQSKRDPWMCTSPLIRKLRCKIAKPRESKQELMIMILARRC
ncbi:hypothetical protein CsSME_00036756 [Camellia sinensis var. sinensis]